jgi:hypothetical protein
LVERFSFWGVRSPLGGSNQAQNQPGAQNQSRPGDVGDPIVDEAVPERPATPTTSETLQRVNPGGMGQGQGAGGMDMQRQQPLPGAQNQTPRGDVGDPIVDEAVPERPATPSPTESMQRSQPSSQGQGSGAGFGGTLDRDPSRFGTRSSEDAAMGIDETFVNFNYGREDSGNFTQGVGDTYRDKIGPEMTNVYRLQNE